jgi:hypothetical protein
MAFEEMKPNSEASSIGETKTGSNQVEDVEKTMKTGEIHEERVLLTEEDVSFLLYQAQVTMNNIITG